LESRHIDEQFAAWFEFRMQLAEDHAIIFDVLKHIDGINRIRPAILHFRDVRHKRNSFFQQPLTLGVIRPTHMISSPAALSGCAKALVPAPKR